MTTGIIVSRRDSLRLGLLTGASALLPAAARAASARGNSVPFTEMRISALRGSILMSWREVDMGDPVSGNLAGCGLEFEMECGHDFQDGGEFRITAG